MSVSIAVALYNGEMYLREQLDSIKNQTYKIDEVILCDDKSSDHTYQMVSDYIQENNLDEKWKVYINEENLGYASNFMEAVYKTSGDYIFFCDQDDIWIEDRVEKMVAIMEKNSEIQLLASEFIPFYCTNDAPVIAKSVLKKMTSNNEIEHIKLNHNSIFIGCEGCTMCIRKTLFEKTDKYWFEGWAHDEYVWKMALCLDGLYIYHNATIKRRLHSNNVSKRKMRNLKKRIAFLEDLLLSHKQMLAFAIELKLYKKDLKLIEKNIRSVELRIGLMREKKLTNILILLFVYFNNYHSRKSIPVEFVMALRE